MNAEIHTSSEKKNQLANRMLISTNMHLLKGHKKISEQFVSHLIVCVVSIVQIQLDREDKQSLDNCSQICMSSF